MFRGDWLDFFFFLVQNIRMLKLHVNFILQAQNPHKRPSEVLVLQYIQHTVHHPWREHKPVLCHFQLHTPRSKCRFFSMWSHSVQQQKFSAQPAVLGFHEQKGLARIPVAPSGTLQSNCLLNKSTTNWTTQASQKKSHLARRVAECRWTRRVAAASRLLNGAWQLQPRRPAVRG